MSDILEKLQALAEQAQYPCPVVRVASELDDEAGAYVLKLLDNDTVSIRQIYLILKEADISVARESLTNHRKQTCGCFRDE